MFLCLGLKSLSFVLFGTTPGPVLTHTKQTSSDYAVFLLSFSRTSLWNPKATDLNIFTKVVDIIYLYCYIHRIFPRHFFDFSMTDLLF